MSSKAEEDSAESKRRRKRNEKSGRVGRRRQGGAEEKSEGEDSVKGNEAANAKGDNKGHKAVEMAIAMNEGGE